MSTGEHLDNGGAFAIRRRILLPLVGGIGVMLGAFLVSVQLMYLQQESAGMERFQREVEQGLAVQQANALQEIDGMADVLVLLDSLREPFLRRDREGLQRLAEPLLDHFRDHHDITHFYFLTPGMETFLRVHMPGRHGDRIQRLVNRQALESGMEAEGLELGPLGTLTLRVVIPWKDGEGKPIGFIELGKEFSHVLREMHRSRGVELHMFLDKGLIDADSWFKGMGMMGLPTEGWDRFPDWAWVGGSVNGLPDTIGNAFAPPAEGFLAFLQRVTCTTTDHIHYLGVPLRDVMGRPVGRVVAAIDEAVLRESARSHVLTVVPVVLLVGVVLLWWYFGTLGGVERLLHRATAALRSREARLHNIQQTALDAIVVLDRQGRVRDLNPAAANLFEWPVERLRGQPVQAILPGDYFPWHQAVLMALQGGGEAGKRLELQGRDWHGAPVDLELTISAFQGEGEEPVVTLFCRDITERKQMVRRLNDALTAAQEASAAKSAFLATMSHEIRTPLNAILGMAELLAESPLNPEQGDYVRVFQRAGENLHGIINDILDLSKIESGRIQLEHLPFPLERLVGECTALFTGTARDKGVQLTWRVEPPASGERLGDPLRLRQVLSNLLSNAIKFTERGEVRVEASLAPPGVEGAEPWVRLAVSDSGIGISPQQQEAIFHPFVQADASTTRRYGGTGLGLTICRKLMELMGGELTVESVVGEGSLFVCLLPLPQRKPVGQGEGQGDDAGEGEQIRPLRILVADDDESNRLLIRAFLKQTPHLLEMAADGLQALESLCSSSFDLALMDMQMPNMDGFTAVRRFREWERERERERLPILALTAFAMEDDRRRVMDAGCTAFLPKPIRKADLLQAIRVNA